MEDVVQNRCTEENLFCTYHPNIDQFTYSVPDSVFYSITAFFVVFLLASFSFGLWRMWHWDLHDRVEKMVTIVGANLVLGFCLGEFILNGLPRWERPMFFVASFAGAALAEHLLKRCPEGSPLRHWSCRVAVQCQVACAFFVMENSVLTGVTLEESASSQAILYVTCAVIVYSVWRTSPMREDLRSGVASVRRWVLGVRSALRSYGAAGRTGRFSLGAGVLATPLPTLVLAGEPYLEVLKRPPDAGGAFGPLFAFSGSPGGSFGVRLRWCSSGSPSGCWSS